MGRHTGDGPVVLVRHGDDDIGRPQVNTDLERPFKGPHVSR